MLIADVIQQSVGTIASPAILSFSVGIAGARVRSGLALPESLLKSASLFLLMVIGYKGGAALGITGFDMSMIVASASAIGLSLIMAAVAFITLRRAIRLDDQNAGAIAAHYGSVSVVTFVTAAAYLDMRGIPYDGFMIALLALMESPGIVLALALVQGRNNTPHGGMKRSLHIVKESFLNPGILVLLGGIACGILLSSSFAGIAGDIITMPFYVILSVFLLGMGLKAGAGMRDFSSVGRPLILFAVVMPFFGSVLGALAGTLLGWDAANVFLLAVLCASASYIAAPAVARTALPGANPGFYVTTSLAITFPFNILIGITLYFHLAHGMIALLR